MYLVSSRETEGLIAQIGGKAWRTEDSIFQKSGWVGDSKGKVTLFLVKTSALAKFLEGLVHVGLPYEAHVSWSCYSVTKLNIIV